MWLQSVRSAGIKWSNWVVDDWYHYEPLLDLQHEQPGKGYDEVLKFIKLELLLIRWH